MKVVHIKSGKEEIITKAQWDTIVKNGFQSDFKVLSNPVVPQEVQKAVKQASNTTEETPDQH